MWWNIRGNIAYVYIEKAMEDNGKTFSSFPVAAGFGYPFEEQQSPAEQTPPCHVKEPQPSSEGMIRCRYEGHIGESLLSKSEFYVNRRVCKKCFRRGTKRQKVIIKDPPLDESAAIPQSLREEMDTLRSRMQSLERIARSLQGDDK